MNGDKKIFDLHCDTLTEAMKQKTNLWDFPGQFSWRRVPKGFRYAQTFAVFIPDELRGEAAWQYYCRSVEYFKQQLDLSKNDTVQAKDVGELERVWKSGHHAAILAVEGGAALAGRIDRLDSMARDGVKLITITWNGANELAAGIRAQGGLTPFGHAVVRRMEKLKIGVDVSHLNDTGFWELTKTVTKPPLATHSNSRVICNHPRNLTDDQFRWISEAGGIVGLNFYTKFLSEEQPVCKEHLIRHIDHLLGIGGENTLALGSDFDGAEMPGFLPNVEKIPALGEIFREMRLGSELTEKLLWRNAANYFKKYL